MTRPLCPWHGLPLKRGLGLCLVCRRGGTRTLRRNAQGERGYVWQAFARLIPKKFCQGKPRVAWKDRYDARA